MTRSATRYPLIVLFLLGILLPAHAPAQEADAPGQSPAEDSQQQDTISTLRSLLDLQAQLKLDIKETGKLLGPSAGRSHTG